MKFEVSKTSEAETKCVEFYVCKKCYVIKHRNVEAAKKLLDTIKVYATFLMVVLVRSNVCFFQNYSAKIMILKINLPDTKDENRYISIALEIQFSLH